MQAGVNCTPKSYWRAATQRIEVARFLIKNSSYNLDAVYLAGYAAECSLKSLILKRTPRSKWAAVCEEISSGAKAHNLDFLGGIMSRSRVLIPTQITASLNSIASEWMTNLRYVGARLPHAEAENFVKHVESIYGWAEGRMR